jgi:hypothetical protein
MIPLTTSLTHSLFAPYVERYDSVPDDQQPSWWKNELPKAEETLLKVGESVFHHQIILDEAQTQLYEGYDDEKMMKAWSLLFNEGKVHKYQTGSANENPESGKEEEDVFSIQEV